MDTRISQWHPREFEIVSTDFMEGNHLTVVGISRDQDFIIYIPFTFDRQRTLEGAHTVCIQKLTCDRGNIVNNNYSIRKNVYLCPSIQRCTGRF